MRTWIMIALLGLVVHIEAEMNTSYMPLSYPGDGCPDYTLDHSVSVTLDTDAQGLSKLYSDPSVDPESLAFQLYGQRYWYLKQLNPTDVKVFFTYGGYTVLRVCVFKHQIGVQVKIVESKGTHFQDQNLTGATIVLKFLPESWYGNRVVLNIGFSLGTQHSDETFATNIMWTCVTSVVHQTQAIFGAYPCGYEYHTTSGYCNNVGHHTWGAIEQPMRRLYYNDPDPRWLVEKDGVPVDNSRPSARKISNNLLNQYEDTPTASGVNMLWVSFGQFIDHDIALSMSYGPDHPLHKTYNIPVRPDDHYFFKKANDANCKDVDVYDGGYRKAEHPKEDKNGSDKDEGDAKTGPICKYNSIVFFRSQKYLHKGVPLKPYVQYNSQTSFLDLSQVYGNTAAKIKFLRSYEDGMLKTSKHDTLPYNGREGVGMNLVVEAEDEHTAQVAGDQRCNEQPYLTMMHTLWMREHNTVASELKRFFPNWADERLFQEARKITTAEYQGIVYNEWLSFLLGYKSLGHYKGYKQCVDPSMSVFFSTCAFRFGHSMVTKELKVADYYLRDLLRFPIEKTLFQHKIWDIFEVSIDTLFLGAYKLIAEEFDAQVQNALRNHLFTDHKEGTSAGFDLPASNIQRCRDHACPSWSDARKNFRLPTPTSWKSLPEFLEYPKDAYKIINTYGPRNLYNLDPFVIGLMEKKVPGALVGGLFHSAIADQFWRLREGDRFYYENIHINCDVKKRYRRINTILQGRVTIKDIFLRNFDKRTDYILFNKLSKILPKSLFLSPDHTLCDPPISILKPIIASDSYAQATCPEGSERIQRFFWDAHYKKPVEYTICDIDGALVNNLKGFVSESKVLETCSRQGQAYGPKKPY